ncbi:BnaA10g09630D [Brassica napus]|uniref:(rape) hypothetical protein n=1 Tax=Brassica napus TaxID=3708 RepID=A0A078FVY9_BRANA|nr:unnamed protein product [Brassica napus]CDY17329.1 BnaA10g09630D [Brassica napus]
MEEELKNFIKVLVSTIISVSYCYYLSTRIKPGVIRLLSVLPVCVLFLLLPLFFSSVHFSGSAAFFFTWLANFKLILFSFDKGPLYPLPQTLSRFIYFTCFPIKSQHNPKSQNEIPKWVFAIKVIIFGVLLRMYDYKQHMSLLIIYSLHIYLELEIGLMLVKALVFISLECDLEPQFNEPYFMVTAILRPAVYDPVQRIAEWKMSSDHARFLAVLATFLVSGAVHELIFFYITHEMPTGEVTWFFVLHGVCTAVEVAVKKRTFIRRWKMSHMVSRPLTVGFVVLTTGWLFFPPLIRSGMFEKLPNEVLLCIDFVKPKLFNFGS